MTRELKGAKVLVVGMAKSGLAAVDLAARKGARVIACDSKAFGDLPDAVRARLMSVGAEFRRQSDAGTFAGVDLIVLAPGVPLDAVPAEVATPVIGELELAAADLLGPVIGITGSNGKTTTTSLAHHILHESGVACQLGGNIGVPPAAMVEASREGQWNVLELSSFQLETIQEFRAHIGVCLNVTPDHLDRHKTMEAYAAAKRRLFETQMESDWAVLNADDTICSSYAAHTRAKVVWFSLEHPVEAPGFWFDGAVLRDAAGTLMAASEIPVRGRHNVENTLAAACAARLAGVEVGLIRKAVRSFGGVEHRLEFVAKLDGVDYFNDSKATNVDATLKAIAAFDGGLRVILGGKDKGSDYTVLREPLLKKARQVLLIGAAAEKIASQIGDAVPVVRAGDLRTAVETANRESQAGDTVLLAPACASFDQFESYEHRGREFKKMVNGLVMGRNAHGSL